MAWKCPACQTLLHHDVAAVQLGVVYRCHVCRLELIVDPVRPDTLTVAPLSPPEKRIRKSER